MSKAMRQMPGTPWRVGVAHGKARNDLISDKACGPLLGHRDTGSVKSKAGPGGLLAAALTRDWASQETHDLKLSTRPVRTGMPGGVAGVQPIMAAPRRMLGPCALRWLNRSQAPERHCLPKSCVRCGYADGAGR